MQLVLGPESINQSRLAGNNPVGGSSCCGIQCLSVGRKIERIFSTFTPFIFQ